MQQPPLSCPGTSSKSAGSTPSCAGCSNQAICSESTPIIDPDIALIAQKLAHIKYKILILSGKGGFNFIFKTLIFHSF